MSHVPASLARRVLAFFDNEPGPNQDIARDLAASLRRCGFGSPKRSAKPARERREAKRAAHREETGAIRAAVVARAKGYCEACGGSVSAAVAHLDHWLSGSGRRRAEQSVASTWFLCPRCDDQRTRNYPSAKHWNDLFCSHARKHGYPEIRHVEHVQLVGGNR